MIILIVVDIISRNAVLRTLLRTIVIDGDSVVCPSVCLSRSRALQKRLNRSRCRLRYWLGCAQGSMS